MKKVVLISNYFHFIQEKASNRYRELADLISQEDGLELEVVTSRFYQRTKIFRSNIDELCFGLKYKVTFIDEPGYSKNISFKRLYTSKIFAKNVLKYLKSNEKPDVIYQVIPTIDVAYVVSKYANRNGIPFILDIQDLWPEAFRMAFNVPVISDLAFFPYKLKVDGIYSRADDICAVSSSYVDRAKLVNKKNIQGHPVYIGINLNDFDKYSEKAMKGDSDNLKIAYCGSMDKSYDIRTVIDALSLMNNPPQLVAMGDGVKRQEFEKYAKEKKIKAEFTGYLPYPLMCKKLCECDMTVNPIIGTSVASIINKHGDYAASGLPVLNTQESSEYKALVASYNMGFNCTNGDAKDLATKISILCENKDLRLKMGKNARKCAEEKFDRSVTYKELVNVIKMHL